MAGTGVNLLVLQYLQHESESVRNHEHVGLVYAQREALRIARDGPHPQVGH